MIRGCPHRPETSINEDRPIVAPRCSPAGGVQLQPVVENVVYEIPVPYSKRGLPV